VTVLAAAPATTRPLRVVHLIDTLRPGGAERLVVTTVKHLDPRCFRPAVVALGEPLDLAPALAEIGVPVACVGVRSPLDWRHGVVHLAAVLRRLRPDVLHTHLRLSNVYGRVAAVLAGVPRVVTSLHHLDYTHWPARTLRARAWRAVDRYSAHRVNRGFVAVSHAVATDYRHHFGLRDVQVIHNYIEVEPFRRLAAGRAEARRRLGLRDDELVVLNVARLAAEKGQRHLMDAVALLQRRHPSVRLIFVGDGPERQALQTQADALGIARAVVLAGVQTDVNPFLAAADVFAFPSVGEGLGIALMEAMATGLPVVASRADGIVEVVEDGVDGLLVAPGDPVPLAEALGRLAGDPALRRRLGEAARGTIASRFSARVGVPRLEAVYTQLVHAAGARNGEAQ